MSIEELARSIREGVNRVKRNIPNHYREAGVNLTSLIDERISETGTDAQGQRLKGRSGGLYSPEYLAKKTKKFGRVPTIIDLTFEGDMWRNIGVLETPVLNGTKIRMSIGARDEENQKKVAQNTRRYGDFLEASVNELEEVGAILTSRVAKDLGL